MEEQKNHFAALAITDGLTQIANRYHTEEILGQEIATAARDGRPCGVVLFDIDHFKAFNDRFGHNEGDRLLVALAREVASIVRETDHLGRWGGEEFMIVVSNASLGAAAQLAERVRKAAVRMSVDRLPSVTLSLGVAQWQLGDDQRSLVLRADEALYQAKARGRNRVVIAPHGKDTP